jgi:L-ascorbate metabolism protein UlaG (beta-lactamase superfamily)
MLSNSMIFPRFRPRAELRPRGAAPAGEGVRIRWLGTAGFIIQTRATTVMIDPFLTRASLRTVVSRPLVSDEVAVRARLPARLDAVICGHSHYDHLLDAPLIARITGAKLIGSATTCAFGRAQGVAAERLVSMDAGGATTNVGDLEITFVPSLHGRLLLGRVPFPGTLASAPELPARVWQYPTGGVFGILLRVAGTTIYHNGSADLIDANLAGQRAQVLLVGIAGRRATRDYARRLLTLLQPDVVVPTHHDAFFAPLEEGVRLLPGIDLDGFISEARNASATARFVTPLYNETICWHAESRSAFLED